MREQLSAIEAQQSFLAQAESEVQETEAEQARRVAWIKHYIKLGDYDRAIELGWDGDMEFAQTLLNPDSTPIPDSGAETPLDGMQTPGADVSAGGAEGGMVNRTSKQLCRI
jgi:hypothetical protein